MAIDKIPFIDGKLASYSEYWGNQVLEWRPNAPFEATLHAVCLERGRSAARII